MNDPVFERLLVDYIVIGGSRVTWVLNRHFIDPAPYSFQLQFGRVGTNLADDWIDVGGPVTGTDHAFDADKRLFGKEVDAFYRVELTTNNGIYYSQPEQAQGVLGVRDWLLVREMVRKELLRHSVFTSVTGYLLKARRYGPACTHCTDLYTKEISQSNCTTCYGTGFLAGYYDPIPATYADIGVGANVTNRDGQHGTVKQDMRKARFVGDPQLYTYDVWINKYSDERYYIREVETQAQHRGINVVFSVELKLAPYTDIIYTLPIQNFSLKPKDAIICLPIKKKAPGLNYLEAMMKEAKGKQRTRSLKH